LFVLAGKSQRGFTACGAALIRAHLAKSIMRKLQAILLLAVGIALSGCSKPGVEEARSPNEVDSLVDEVWIELNGWKPVPLKQWLAESASNEVDFLTREEALRIAERSLKEYGVELLAVTGDDTPHWSQFVIGRASGIKDKPAYTQALLAASARRTLEIEYGVKWVVLTEQLDEDGNSISK
jgi:hypothetical protein